MIFHHVGGIMGNQYYRYACFLTYQAYRMRKWTKYEKFFLFGYACAKDRMLKSEGRPQLWGMQCERSGNLWYVAGGTEDWVTEEARKQWNCPTMQERVTLYGGPRLYHLERRRIQGGGGGEGSQGEREGEGKGEDQRKGLRREEGGGDMSIQERLERWCLRVQCSAY
eukprot:gnl/MRDRNA2_/MRDRNA2_80035_c0_seq1.p1 gnl/MRDRNA2_/MRDRNA2_80035_c0~~gnl/MRDRNA2_/MRDRNA2_80035_c0_seq1.p1  ORF type:complete len:192 (+),score=21.61 gnl/MRDRNA2_/MRDRNA2_80035_c0_seq1:76-576(+)